MVSGTSMLPHFHTGDLVLLRDEPTYRVGEVAGYHNGLLHAVVMHRIVAVKDGHYFFKGDNNHFVDPYHPTRSQIVGAEWIELPGVGRYLQDLRVPVVGAVFAAALWVLSFRSRPTTRRRRRRRHRHAQ
jgi:signal peptidase I